MKKFYVYFMLALCLLCVLPFGVSAAGSASLNGPGELRAGDTITLTFSAGGGISGGSGTVSYDSSVLTLQSQKQTIAAPYVVQFNGSNFVFYDDSMKSPISGSQGIFQLVFTVNAGAATGASVSVKITNLVLSDGNADIPMGTVSYSKTVSKPLSDNCNLRSMTVTGASISPAFSPSVTSYTASVPFATEKLTVSAVAEHEKAKVAVSNPALTPGGTTKIQVTVTAEKGNTKTYTLSVTRERDPNYVESSNAQLKALTAEGFLLSPSFDPAVTQYYVWLPYETETFALSAQAEDSKAGASVGDFVLTPGVGTDIPVTVTAEDGTQKTYIVTAVRAPEHEKTEDYLGGARQPIPEETLPEETVPETIPPATTTPEPEAESAQPAPDTTLEETTGYSLGALLITGILAVVVGAAVTVLIFSRKKIF